MFWKARLYGRIHRGDAEDAEETLDFPRVAQRFILGGGADIAPRWGTASSLVGDFADLLRTATVSAGYFLQSQAAPGVPLQ